MGGKEPLNGDVMGHRAEREDVGWKGGMVEGGRNCKGGGGGKGRKEREREGKGRGEGEGGGGREERVEEESI